MPSWKEDFDQAVGMMTSLGLASIQVRRADWSIELTRDGQMVAAGEGVAVTPAPAPAAAPAEQPKGTPVTSPMTGIFYAAPNPGSDPFVKVGDVVEAGQVVGLIEAMKVFNDITAPMAGTVLSVEATNGAIVNPGDVLVRIG